MIVPPVFCVTFAAIGALVLLATRRDVQRARRWSMRRARREPGTRAGAVIGS